MPKRRDDIDRILDTWKFEPGDVIARMTKGGDGRDVLQMRIEMGLLQMEAEGRPDGTRPGGFVTYLEFLKSTRPKKKKSWTLTEPDCGQVDREFLQFYHRRICWLTLRKFAEAMRDADHTLALMDFVRQYGPDRDWVISHEQYRPFVLFHRTQAASLVSLASSGPEAAIESLAGGLERFRELFHHYEADEEFEQDEFVQRLMEMKDALRAHYHLKLSLTEQLADAVAEEKYELAARLRDEILRQQAGQTS